MGDLLNSFDDLIPKLLDMGMKALLILGAILLVLYTVQAVILSETHKLRYGKKSFMAWIPGLNFYILGKVALNRIFGILLFLSVALTGTITFGTPGEETVVNLLPKDINDMISNILPYIIIIFYIITIIRYKVLLNRGGVDKSAARVVSKKTLNIPNNNS